MKSKKKPIRKSTKRSVGVKLGDHVRDVYTGYEGTAIGRTEWLHGCARIGVEPTTLDKDGKVQEAQWFDEQRVQVIAKQPPVNLAPHVAAGGPTPAPARQRDPAR